jgi:deoxyribodipyrimidine photolyase-related protein
MEGGSVSWVKDKFIIGTLDVIERMRQLSRHPNQGFLRIAVVQQFPAQSDQTLNSPFISHMRNLIIILGDQLNVDSAALDHFDPNVDAIWMAEVAQESTKVWSSKPRTTTFLSAMRHFRDELLDRDWKVIYRELTITGGLWQGLGKTSTTSAAESFTEALAESMPQLKPEQWIMVEPGEWDVREELRAASESIGVPLEMLEDRHFLCSSAQFAAHAAGRKQLRMEFFYREMRQRYHVLMDQGKPVGGEWNFDSENRKSFGKAGPPLHLPPRRFMPDKITAEVITMVNTRFASHPGDLTEFDWPVTAADAGLALEDFVKHRLTDFGDWQDAMWTAEPWLFHSRLSAVMNLKLLDPRTVIAAAESAWKQGLAPLAGVEGFIRQILGWREYVRGIYWHQMPGYRELNAQGADQPLPAFYWTGETEMACLRDALGQTLRLGYAHHIQRLMVTGLYALMLGVRPREVHEWYLAVYVDAVEWVELPNTLGMSQHADGGLMASKPYIATGKYIQRMSNYCTGCRYDPALSTGPTACPFTTLYWDFLLQHEPMLRKNQRMSLQVRNLARLDEPTRHAIQQQAAAMRNPS